MRGDLQDRDTIIPGLDAEPRMKLLLAKAWVSKLGWYALRHFAVTSIEAGCSQSPFKLLSTTRHSLS
jgi:hypothetical protein